MARISYATLSYYFAIVKGRSPKDFKGKKGIIIFSDCNWRNATGHVDLFNGKTVEGHGYFDFCEAAILYELK